MLLLLILFITTLLNLIVFFICVSFFSFVSLISFVLLLFSFNDIFSFSSSISSKISLSFLLYLFLSFSISLNLTKVVAYLSYLLDEGSSIKSQLFSPLEQFLKKICSSKLGSVDVKLIFLFESLFSSFNIGSIP